MDFPTHLNVFHQDVKHLYNIAIFWTKFSFGQVKLEDNVSSKSSLAGNSWVAAGINL